MARPPVWPRSAASVVSTPTSPSGSCQRIPPTLVSSGNRPLAGYQRCREIHSGRNSWNAGCMLGGGCTVAGCCGGGVEGGSSATVTLLTLYPQPEEVARPQRESQLTAIWNRVEAGA